VLEQKVLATGLVLTTRRVEFSRDDDLSGVMEDDTDPNQSGIDWEMEGASQLEQTLSRLADQRDMAQETRWRAQACKQESRVFNGGRIEPHALV
jgi:hypothetical protein